MSLLLSQLGGAPPSAGAAPGWDTQPPLVSRSRAIARATAAAVVTAGIEAVFVPPVVQTPAWGFEAQPQTIARRVNVAEPQESVPFASRPVAFVDGQPGPVTRKARPRHVQDSLPAAAAAPSHGFEAQPSVIKRATKALGLSESGPLDTAAPVQVAYEFLTDQPSRVVSRSRAAPVTDGWPVDAIQVAQPFVAWGFDTQPGVVRAAARVAGVEPDATLVRAAAPWGFDGQPPRILQRARVGAPNESGPVDVTVAFATLQWGFEAQPRPVMPRGRRLGAQESVPLDVAVVVEPAAWGFDAPAPAARAGASKGWLFSSKESVPPFAGEVQPPQTPAASGGSQRPRRWASGAKYFRLDRPEDWCEWLKACGLVVTCDEAPEPPVTVDDCDDWRDAVNAVQARVEERINALAHEVSGAIAAQEAEAARQAERQRLERIAEFKAYLDALEAEARERAEDEFLLLSA